MWKNFKVLLRFSTKVPLKHLGKFYLVAVLKGQKMSINEVVCSFITLKKYDKRNGILPFETEKMLDDMIADNTLQSDAQRYWIGTK